jgi:hypothetical protein
MKNDDTIEGKEADHKVENEADARGFEGPEDDFDGDSDMKEEEFEDQTPRKKAKRRMKPSQRMRKTRTQWM